MRLPGWRRAVQGAAPCSTRTGAYCTARNALTEEACHKLVCRTGKELEAQSPVTWLWHRRNVRVVDGSTVTMPDTPENQAEYPQMKSQKPGCGLPIARVLVVFSLAVGVVLEAAIGPYKGKRTGENSLFRTLHEMLQPGEIVLADRYFSGWFDMALLKQRGVDVVVRKHQRRATDFRSGQRLGHDDHLVRIPKPSRPEWMAEEQYAALPNELELREVRVRVKQRGFRRKTLVVVTTLLDAEEFSAEEIANLFRLRWQAELQLRSLKIALQMDHLRCKTPQRVRNEFYMHLLAYNLLRRVMALAAFEAEVPPWQISFKATLQTLSNFLPLLASCMPLADGCAALLSSLKDHIVGNRPDRFEPRRIKRRPKNYKLMQKPRAEYKSRMR